MIKDYLALGKPRIALMVGATTALGYKMGGGTQTAAFWAAVFGTTLCSVSCGSLNQLLEREQDAVMKRTAGRPLPSGRLTPLQALSSGLLSAAVGLSLLYAFCGLLATALTACTIVLYVGVYTPLKQVTPQSTWIGAAAGAASPLVGWAAGAGSLSLMAWLLFAIQFLWQIPHFLAMFWLHREDYARAGFRVMPVVSPGGAAAQIALHSFTILPVTLLPVLWGRAGPVYGLAALALGVPYLGLGLRASWTLAPIDARRLFLASLAYLPVLFGMLLIGGIR